MIIQFTIGNFLSFKEQSTLSLVASALKEIQVPAEDIIFNVGTSRCETEWFLGVKHFVSR